jgi:WD40 repeat protein
MTEAVASVDGLIEVRGVLRGERKCVWRAWDRRDELPRSLAFSARATWLAVGLSTGVVVIWEVGTQAQVARFSEYVSPAGALAFSDQDRYLASAPYAGGLVIRECQSWRVVSRPDAPGGPVYVMVFSRDGTMLCASTGEAVVAWEVATGKMTGLMVPAKGIASVAFSPDGRQVACGCYDKALRVWDVATGQETAEYPTAWPLGAVWWSHDGRIIKAADLGGGTDRPHVYELELAKGATELAEVGATVA